MAHVSWLTIAPVKGLALVEVEELALARDGVAENRRFYLVDADGRRYGLIRDGRLALVRPAWDPARRRLELAFPDGSTVAGEVDVDGEMTTDFYGRPVTGRTVVGDVVIGPVAKAAAMGAAAQTLVSSLATISRGGTGNERRREQAQ